MPTIRAPRALPSVSIGGGVSLVPTLVDVTPASATIAALATQQLTAVVKNANGETLTVQKAVNEGVLSSTGVTWTTSNAAKATVSASGLVTGVASGSCTITATLGTLTDTCAITVS